MQAFHYDSIDSTNEEAKRLILAHQIQKTAYLWAKEQTQGKGTQGRVWVSPKNAGLYFSWVQVFPERQLPPSQWLTLAAGVACAQTLQELLGLSIHLKPINDLYVQQKKLGGILVESLIQESHLKALITGIGINLTRVERVLAEGVMTPIALQELLPPFVFERLSSQEFIEALIEKLDSWYEQVFLGNTYQIEQVWRVYQLPGSEFPLI